MKQNYPLMQLDAKDSLTAGFCCGPNRCAPAVVRMVVGTMRSSAGDGDAPKRVDVKVSSARFVSVTSPFSSVLYKMFGSGLG